MENSVLFASYGFASRLIHAGDADGMPFSKKLMAGGFSGFCVAAVLTPVELIKCKMQTANESVRACFAVHIWVWGLGAWVGCKMQTTDESVRALHSLLCRRFRPNSDLQCWFCLWALHSMGVN